MIQSAMKFKFPLFIAAYSVACSVQTSPNSIGMFDEFLIIQISPI